MTRDTKARSDMQASSRSVASAPGRLRGRRGFTLTEILAVIAILSMITVSLFTMFRQGTETWRLSSARTEAFIKARQILDMMSREIRGAVLITAARGPSAQPVPPSMAKRADFVGLNGDNPAFNEESNKVTIDDKLRKRAQQFSDQLYFVAPVTNSGKQELCMIGYWIRDMDDPKTKLPGPDGVPRDSKDDVFQRAYRTDTNGQPDAVWCAFDFFDESFSSSGWEGSSGAVAASVRQLDVKYYDYDYSGGSPRLKEYNTWDSLPSTKGGTTIDDYDDNKLPVAVRITIMVGDEGDLIKPIRLSTIVSLDNAGRR